MKDTAIYPRFQDIWTSNSRQKIATTGVRNVAINIRKDYRRQVPLRPPAMPVIHLLTVSRASSDYSVGCKPYQEVWVDRFHTEH